MEDDQALPPAPDDIDENTIGFIDSDSENEIPDDFMRVYTNSRRMVNEMQRSELPMNNSLFEHDEEALREIDLALGTVDLNSRNKTKTKLKQTRRRYQVLTPEQRQMIGMANNEYCNNNYQQALNILKSLVSIAPDAPEPWTAIGAIYNDKGEHEKSIAAYFMAAHLNPKDSGLWIQLAEMLSATGKDQDAVYCYTKALKTVPDDVGIYYERALLYLKLKQVGRAIKGFETVLKYIPTNLAAIKELSKFYIEMGKSQEALEYFAKVLEQDRIGPQIVYNDDYSDEEDEQPEYRINFEELNMMGELYFELADYETCFHVLVECTCRLLECGSNDQIFFTESSKIPVEINSRAAMCLIMMDDPSAMKLLEKTLFKQEKYEFESWFLQVADFYMKKLDFSSVVTVLKPLTLQENTNIDKTRLALAKAYYHMQDYEKAIEMLNESSDLEAIILLATCFQESGNDEKAKQCFERADQLSKTMHSDRKKSRRMPFLTSDSEDKQQRTVENRKNFDLLVQKFSNGSESRADLKICLDLINQFRYNRQFFPSERSRVYQNTEDAYVGLWFDEWLQVFIMTAKIYTRDKNQSDAIANLNIALKSSVFYHNPQTKMELTLHIIACALQFKDYRQVLLHTRALVQQNTLMNDHLRLLFITLCSGGQKAIDCMDSSLSKFFSRCYKELEAVTNELNSTSSSHQDYNAVVCCAYAHMFLVSKTFKRAFELYARAFAVAPKDPQVNLFLGNVYLQMAMQRTTDNRNKQVLLGISFMFQYYELSEKSPEAAFNVGRAFHHLELHTFAVDFYNRSLQGKFKREAAYNLSMIYMQSGNPGLATHTLKTYCTI